MTKKLCGISGYTQIFFKESPSETVSSTYTSDGTYNYVLAVVGNNGKFDTDGSIILSIPSLKSGGAHTCGVALVNLQQGQYITASGWGVYLYGLE